MASFVDRDQMPKINALKKDESYQRRAEITAKTNKARGLSDEIQQEIRRLYFDEQHTAQNVSKLLNVSHGSVRSTISRFYSTLALSDRIKFAKHGGQWLRSEP